MSMRAIAVIGLGFALAATAAACGRQRPADTPAAADLSALSAEAQAALGPDGEPLVPARYVMEAVEAGVPIVFLDARPPLDYEFGHIPGALSAPYFEAEQHAQSLPKDGLYVTYCECPHAEAVQLADALVANGFPNVKTIDEGLQGWRDLGGELVGGTPVGTAGQAAPGSPVPGTPAPGTPAPGAPAGATPSGGT